MTAVGVTITNGALIAFSICMVCVFVAIGLLYYQEHQIRDERNERARQDAALFLTNCITREREIRIIHKVLDLPPTRVTCQLPK